MKLFLILFSTILSINLAHATSKSEQFKNLENSIDYNPNLAIAALLKPYGDLSEFKIFDESTTTEICSQKTVIRAKVTCDKKIKTKNQIHFAEGKGLLCEISDNFRKIRCLQTINN